MSDSPTLNMLVDSSALATMSDAVYFDNPVTPKHNVSIVLPLRWLASAGVKEKIKGFCPPDCVPVQTRMRSRLVDKIEPDSQYILSASFVFVQDQLRLSIEYDVLNVGGTLALSGAVEMTFLPLDQIARL